MAKRRLSSWTQAFYDFTDSLSSPTLFRKWAAISLVAGALERKVWIKSALGALYPNLYVILVGPPGVGKTVLTSRVWAMWAALSDGTDKGHHVASSSVTKASLIDTLVDAERRIVRPTAVPPVETFHSLKICSNELGVLLPSYENDFMNTLTDLYDCHPYSERRRTKDLYLKIDAPQLNMIAATTPSYLNNVLPEGAWDQGFLSRTMLVYSGESIRRPLFEETKLNDKLEKELLEDLKVIGELYGKMTFEPAAAQVISDWHMEGGPPQPEHPKLMHYNTRRTAHLLKLSMVACASRTNNLVINLDDVQQALDWLIEVETFMPDIFKSMAVGGDSRAIQDCWYHVYQIYIKEKRPISEARVIYFLQERVPAHSIMRIIEVMRQAKLLEKQIDGYVPKTPPQR